jgi:hypothetical protein
LPVLATREGRKKPALFFLAVSTAILQRNIVEVVDRTGRKQLTLEEAMRTLRTESIGSDQKVRVAAICDDDKRRALDAVLAETGFDALLEQVRTASGKPKAEFRRHGGAAVWAGAWYAPGSHVVARCGFSHLVR